MYKQYLYKSVFTEKNIFDVPLVGVSICDATYRVERMNSNFYVFEYVYKGKGTLHINNQTFHPEKGDMYILPANSNHLYYSNEEDPWKKIWFHAKGILVDQLIQIYKLSNVFVIKNLDLSKLIIDIVLNTKSRNEKRHNDSSIIFHKLMLEISNHLYALNSQHSDFALEIKNYLDNNIKNKFSLDTLSKKVFKSKAQIIRIFKKEFNITPYEYSIQNRIETAKLLLSNQSHFTIKEIALMLCFADEHYFSSFFKKRVGVSPSDYKKINENVSKYLSNIMHLLLTENVEVIWNYIYKALCVGIDVNNILQECLINSIYTMNNHNDQVLFTKINEILIMLKPYFITPARKLSGKIVLGTLKGDHHNLGKNVLKTVLEGKGLEVFDLGTNVSPEDFILKAMDTNAKIIACSCNTKDTLIEVKKLIAELNKKYLRNNFLIMVGGSSVNQKICNQLSADIYASDAMSAANILLKYFGVNVQ